MRAQLAAARGADAAARDIAGREICALESGEFAF
jgi:hypothetical protein